MKSISSWVISICVVIIIGVAVDIFLEGSKLAKTVKCMCACATLLLIVTPISALLTNKDISFSQYKYEYVVDEQYIKSVNEAKCKMLENSIENGLDEYGVSNAEVDIDIVDDNGESVINYIKINLTQSVIDEKFQHINKNEVVRKWILKYIKIDEERLEIYG